MADNYRTNINPHVFFFLSFVFCRKRVIRVQNSSEDDVNLVNRELTIGKQTKSVQVLD